MCVKHAIPEDMMGLNLVNNARISHWEILLHQLAKSAQHARHQEMYLIVKSVKNKILG